MGAALFLSSETPISNPLFSIKNNVFDSNYAVNGAVIYLENGNIVMKNNTFMFNRGDSGGAIYLSCLDTALIRRFFNRIAMVCQRNAMF